MKKNLFDDDARGSLLARIRQVGGDSRARWGKMNAQQMLAHLTESLRMGTGEISPKPRKLPIRYFPLKQLIIYWLPFPKGAPTAPELLPVDERTLDHSKTELARLLEEFGRRRDQTKWPEHPAFGKLTRRGWGVLTYRHFDHHLRQFGA